MKIVRKIRGDRGGGFSLIELLVVIAIIAILAGMLFPVTAWINRGKILKKAQTELNAVNLAIQLYQGKYNSYPPDNPVLKGGRKYYELNGLYYELGGTTKSAGQYSSMNGGEALAETVVPVIFVATPGFVNTTRSGADDVAGAKNFLPGLKPDGYVRGNFTAAPGSPAVRLLACSIQWPKNLGALVDNFTPAEPNVYPNPWRYKSSGSLRNAGGFDLWVDVVINGKTNRVSNWGPPVVVATPYTD
jgi:prepilin-type N-terminal cleavage/methylation domain-containing protein